MTKIRICVDVLPGTQQYLTALAHDRDETFETVAGHLLDAQVAYRLEVERMKSAMIQHVGEEWL